MCVLCRQSRPVAFRVAVDNSEASYVAVEIPDRLATREIGLGNGNAIVEFPSGTVRRLLRVPHPPTRSYAASKLRNPTSYRKINR